MYEFCMSIISSTPFMILIILCMIIIVFRDQIYTYVVGKAGEHWTKQELKKLNNTYYAVFNDVLIKLDSKYYQIDHVVVSIYGVFVIESKQYNGYITGGKYDNKWIRHVGSKKYYYTNPIKQNYGHVKAVCELLGLSDKQVFNIVCIPSTASIKIDDDGETVRIYELIDKITSYNKVVINNRNNIINIIRNNMCTDKVSRKEHLTMVKNNKKEYDSNMCPKCGGTLVKRDGKYGPFYGCSNYPKCKYIKKISI